VPRCSTFLKEFCDMTTIDNDSAVEALWSALDSEQLQPDEMFDKLTAKLHRLPAFRRLSIGELDLLLADSRREFEHDVSEYRWRLAQTFKRELEFTEQGAAA
jgi:hypothetical protein